MDKNKGWFFHGAYNLVREINYTKETVITSRCMATIRMTNKIAIGTQGRWWLPPLVGNRRMY